jgi:ribosome-associated protein
MATSEPVRAQPRAQLNDDAQPFAVAAARVAADLKTDDVQVLDLRGLSSLADYFVVGTGTSDRQMHAVLDRIEEQARRMGRKPFKVSDSRSANWILADYVDVVIHLFDRQHRDYYDLDGLWGDAPRVTWSPGEDPGSNN